MKEHIRATALEYLALRPAAAQTPAQITRMVNLQRLLDQKIEVQDTLDALLYLEGLNYVRSFHGELGGEKNWQVTTAGIQYYERGES